MADGTADGRGRAVPLLNGWAPRVWAAECGLPVLAAGRRESLEGPFPALGLAPELIKALGLCDRLLRDHVPGYRPEPGLRRRPVRRRHAARADRHRPPAGGLGPAGGRAGAAGAGPAGSPREPSNRRALALGIVETSSARSVVWMWLRHI
jgi:hypothetical protein